MGPKSFWEGSRLELKSLTWGSLGKMYPASSVYFSSMAFNIYEVIRIALSVM